MKCFFYPFQLKLWLQKLLPSVDTSSLTESRIAKRIKLIRDNCSTLDQPQEFLRQQFEYDVLAPALTHVGICFNHIQCQQLYDRAPQEEITNEVVVELGHLMARYHKPKTFIVNWMRKLHTPCGELGDSQIKTKCLNVLKKNVLLTKNKSGNNLENFLESKFLSPDSDYVKNPGVNCQSCVDKDNLIKSKNQIIKELKSERKVFYFPHMKLPSKIELLMIFNMRKDS